MKIKTIIVFLVLCCSTLTVTAAVPPLVQVKAQNTFRSTNITAKEVEKLLGKKLGLVEKIKLQLLNRKLKKFRSDHMTENQGKQAVWSMVLGIASILLLFTPIGVIAIPAAIVGLILGILSLKGNSNTKGIVGVVTSGVTILLIVAAVIIVAVAFSSGWWG